MNNKADFNLQGMMIGILVMGLFFGLIGGIIGIMGDSYNIDGYNLNDINQYQVMPNISVVVDSAQGQIDSTTVDRNWFDFFSGIFDKLLTPFKFVYRSFSILTGLSGVAVGQLNLLPIFTDFFITLITLLVIVGIVMLKTYMGKQK